MRFDQPQTFNSPRLGVSLADRPDKADQGGQYTRARGRELSNPASQVPTSIRRQWLVAVLKDIGSKKSSVDLGHGVLAYKQNGRWRYRNRDDKSRKFKQ